MQFEYNQVIAYMDNRIPILCRFSEYWEYNSAYITIEGESHIVDIGRLFVTKQLAYQSLIDIEEKSIAWGDNFVSNWEQDKTKKVEKINGYLKDMKG